MLISHIYCVLNNILMFNSVNSGVKPNAVVVFVSQPNPVYGLHVDIL